MKRKQIIYILGVSLAVAILTLVVIYVKKGKKPEKIIVVKPRRKIQSPPSIPKKKAAVVMFYADWCGASRNALPSWEALETAIKSPGAPNVDVMKFEEKTFPGMKQHNITYYPTIRYYPYGFDPNGDPDSKTVYMAFSGSPTPEKLYEFAQTTIN